MLIFKEVLQFLWKCSLPGTERKGCQCNQKELVLTGVALILNWMNHYLALNDNCPAGQQKSSVLDHFKASEIVQRFL